MELCYIWVERYKAFINQGFNLYPRYSFSFDPFAKKGTGSKNQLSVKEKADYLPLFQYRMPRDPGETKLDPNCHAPIAEIAAIIGQNGTGKSSLFELIIMLLQAVERSVGQHDSSVPMEEVFGKTGDESFTGLVYVFKLDANDIKLGTQAASDKYLRGHCFEHDIATFLVLTNLSMVTFENAEIAPSGKIKLVEYLAHQWVCLYYNHTLEDPFRKLKKTLWWEDYLRRGFAKNFFQVPLRANHELSMAAIEKQMERGLIEHARANPVFKENAANLSRFVWWPTQVTLKLKIDVLAWFPGGEKAFDRALSEVMRHGFINIDKNHCLEMVSKIHNGRMVCPYGNALALLALVIHAVALRPNLVFLLREKGIDLVQLFQGRLSEDTIIRRITEPLKKYFGLPEQPITQYEVRKDRFYQEFVEQIRFGLYFNEHFQDVLIRYTVLNKDNVDEAIWDLKELAKSESLTRFLLYHPDWIDLDFYDKKNAKKSLATLSHGERLMLSVLINTNYGLVHLNKSYPGARVLLLMDEPDIGLHPEWQRKIIQLLHEGAGMPGQMIQLVMATHSPFAASDLPHTHITRLKRFHKSDVEKCPDRIEKTRLQNLQHGQRYQAAWPGKTFGGNIHTLLADQFFLDHTIGAFARSKIHHVLLFCHRVQQHHDRLDADHGTHNGSTRQGLEAALLEDLKVFSMGDKNDVRSKLFMQALAGLIGESVLAMVVKNNIAALERIVEFWGAH